MHDRLRGRVLWRAVQAKKAKAKVTNTSGLNLPVAAAPSLYDYSALQKDVGFLGFGDKAKKAANKAGSVAQDVKSNASSVADKASDVADKVGDVRHASCSALWRRISHRFRVVCTPAALLLRGHRNAGHKSMFSLSLSIGRLELCNCMDEFLHG